MLTTMIGFAPFMTCLFWLVLNPLVRKQDKSSRALGLLLAIIGTVSVAQVSISFTTGTTLLVFFLIKQFFTPLLIPTALLYVSRVSPEIRWKPYIPAWLAIPIGLIFAESMLLMLSGTAGFTEIISGGEWADEKVVHLTNLCSFRIFYIALVAQAFIWFILTIVRTAKGIHPIQLYNCTAVILAIAAFEASAIKGLSEWTGAGISIALSCIVFITAYTGTFKCKPAQKAPEAEKPREAREQQPHESGLIIADAHQSIADEEKLRIRFEDLIVTEQLFLKQGIRISDIATMLETNRTYVSRLVNNTYNMSFSDYINTLRIDYAEQYLMHNRDAKQSDIATACGFPNASAFNNVFKKITGVTPKIWLATRS